MPIATRLRNLLRDIDRDITVTTDCATGFTLTTETGGTGSDSLDE